MKQEITNINKLAPNARSLSSEDKGANIWRKNPVIKMQVQCDNIDDSLKSFISSIDNFKESMENTVSSYKGSWVKIPHPIFHLIHRIKDYNCMYREAIMNFDSKMIEVLCSKFDRTHNVEYKDDFFQLSQLISIFAKSHK